MTKPEEEKADFDTDYNDIFDALFEGVESLIKGVEANIGESLAVIEDKLDEMPKKSPKYLIEYSEDEDVASLTISGPVEMIDPWVKMIMTPSIAEKRLIKRSGGKVDG